MTETTIEDLREAMRVRDIILADQRKAIALLTTDRDSWKNSADIFQKRISELEAILRDFLDACTNENWKGFIPLEFKKPMDAAREAV